MQIGGRRAHIWSKSSRRQRLTVRVSRQGGVCDPHVYAGSRCAKDARFCRCAAGWSGGRWATHRSSTGQLRAHSAVTNSVVGVIGGAGRGVQLLECIGGELGAVQDSDPFAVAGVELYAAER
jgi:hypothetical protein